MEKASPLQYRKLILAMMTATALSACGLAHPVDTQAGPARAAAESYSMPGAREPLSAAWYASFGDKTLAELIERALRDNLDVAQAMARLKQADATARQSRALRLPSADIEAGSHKSWEDHKAQEGYSAGGLSFAWEVDAFGRLGAAAQADEYLRDAAAEDVAAVRLALTASVAEAYYSAIAQHLQIRLLRQQADNDGQLLELVHLRQQEGLGTNVEVLQQRGQLAEIQSLLPPAQAQLRVYENRLDVLLGQAPDAANRTGEGDEFPAVGDLPAIGVPSDLLLSRPDLRALRAELVAADAGIAAAMADRLPHVTLNGSYLLADGPAMAGPVAALAAGLVQPLLDWGRRRAAVERNKALYEEKLAAFTQAYLGAVEDVENTLYQEDRQREFIRRLDERRHVLSETFQAAQDVFKQGVSDYQPVLDSLQDLRAVERELLQQQLNLVLLRIRLFRAIGAPISPLTPSPETDNAP